MRRFAQLYAELDATTRTGDKVAALVAYFREAEPADAAWAAAFLTGRRPRRALSGRMLMGWAAELAGIPEWLAGESYDAVGDLAEVVALLLPEPERPDPPPLHRLVDERILALAALPEPERRVLVEDTWRILDAPSRLVWHKLITGEFRVGVARTLVVRALAEVAGTEPAVMAHRLMGSWEPTPEHWQRLLRGDAAGDPARPYPFFLAHPLTAKPATLGAREAWQAEWKWDGIRCQLIRRAGTVVLWSRGEELVTTRFPEVAEAARALPDGVVLDGEVLAWDAAAGRPMPFARLQRRLGRVEVPDKLRREVPVALMAYDMLEHDGVDVRALPQSERRARLERLLAEHPGALRLSPLVEGTWAELAEQRLRARELAVEGLMLKRRDAAYGVGRTVGEWWKWKIDPYTVDAVLIYAQQGHGRRAGLYTDYTFGLWEGGRLVPVAKAYSGLTDAEIREVDRWVRAHTREKHGPVRVVEPQLVFELAFEALATSTRHKSGIAVRFPRMARWRTDKPPEQADRLDSLRALLAAHERGERSVAPAPDAEPVPHA